MAKRRQIVVVGLGRFGTAVAETLVAVGHEVLALDISARRVQEVGDHVTHAAQADGTDPETLRELGVADFDVGVVGVSSQLERSILITLQLKRLGVPYVVAKAQTELHGEVLEKVGADRVVYPEREMGDRLAHSITVPNVLDYLPIGDDYGISKLKPPSSFVGRTVRDLALPDRHGITLLLIERPSQVVINPGPEERIRAQDLLVLAGPDDAMEQLSAES
ncbi:MAG: potassium channel family protein [Dehalococcoidia bacterium]